MEYVFRADDGSTITRDYPVGRAPKIGNEISVAGKRYRRAAVAPGVGVKANYVVGHSLRKKGLPLAPDYDALGIECIKEGRNKDKPVFRNLNQVREFVARDDHKITPNGKLEYEF